MRNIVEKWWEKKNLLIFGILFGIITHGMILFNNFPNGDGLAFDYYTWENTITSGRWFLGIACLISGPFTIPVINGVISIIFVTISSILVIEIFEINNKVNRVLIVGLMLSFPAYASTLLYMFTADGYAIGIFLSVLAVWILKQEATILKFVQAALCIALSLGIYQAYISVTMALCLLYIMQNILLNKDNIIKITIRYLMSGILGGIIYFVILKIALKIRGVSLTSYQGIDDVGQKVGASELILRMKCIYAQTIVTIIQKIFIQKIFLILFIIISFMIFVNLIKNYKMKAIKLILCSFFMPICLMPIYLSSTNVYYYLLMKYGFVFIFIYMVVLLDKIFISNIYVKMSMIGIGIIIYGFIVSNNSMYEYAGLRYNRTLMLANRIQNQLETGNYDTSKSIGIFYERTNDEYYKPVTDIYPYASSKYIEMGPYNIEKFMKRYFTSDFRYIKSKNESDKIMQSEQYKKIKMGKKSFKIIENKKYIIIKIRAGVDIEDVY